MNPRNALLCVLTLTFVAATTAVVVASTNSPVQSPIPPYFGPLVGPVQLAGSDAQAQAFESVKAGYINKVKALLPEWVAFTGVGMNQLDPQRLYFAFPYAPRVYFIYEETGVIDQLGVTIANVAAPVQGAANGTNYTLFNSGRSCTDPLYSSDSGIRSTNEPLYPGDFVQLPTINAGQQLAFCLADNVNAQGIPINVVGVPAVAYNGVSTIDGFQHMIAFFPDNSQYIIIGFEDWFFGDRDCNDMVVVIDIGAQNANFLRNPTGLPK
jgi:hypothetical protein